MSVQPHSSTIDQEPGMSHILVIEDELEFREPLVKMLTNDGHVVAVAGNGVEALDLLKTLRPHLIITDVLMPKMDGIETIVELTRSGNAVPIIAMSGGRRSVSKDFNLASAELMGVRATLAKPFSRADLRAAIQHALATPLLPPAR
jgi:CheY-like chemotaxis protein